MRAAIFESFGGPVTVTQVDDPGTPPDGVVIQVDANGICRSDWHAWQGHDPTVKPPHVLGHELAGRIVSVGKKVNNWMKDQRVTVPFCCGCGTCGYCRGGQTQICDNGYQPGFSGWGAYAQYVAVPAADTNLIGLPDNISSIQAASLGCRFATAYRALVIQGKVRPGDFVAVHGSGGLGLSLIMLAAALGARPVAVDVRDEALELAVEFGAEIAINSRKVERVSSAIFEATNGGAQLSIDALGSRETCINSVMSLRKQGRHVQVGLMVADDRKADIPMARVIHWELSLVGSFGLQTVAYPELLSMIEGGRIDPGRLVQQEVDLEQAANILMSMDVSPPNGIAMITAFD
jgi:alcohol dehydrogenase